MKTEIIFADFDKALGQLRSALATPATTDVVKAGCIQYFEFTFELAWKSIKATAQNLGLPDCLSPRSCLKTAFLQGWIDDEDVWLDMLEDRNKMSHTYHASDALAVYDRLGNFASALQKLSECLLKIPLS